MHIRYDATAPRSADITIDAAVLESSISTWALCRYLLDLVDASNKSAILPMRPAGTVVSSTLFVATAVAFSLLSGCSVVPAISGGTSGPSFWDRIQDFSQEQRAKAEASRLAHATIVQQMHYYIDLQPVDGAHAIAHEIPKQRIVEFLSVGQQKLEADYGIPKAKMSWESFRFERKSSNELISNIAFGVLQFDPSAVLTIEGGTVRHRELIALDLRASRKWVYQVTIAGFVAAALESDRPNQVAIDAELRVVLKKRQHDDSGPFTPVTRINYEAAKHWGTQLEDEFLDLYISSMIKKGYNVKRAEENKGRL